MKKPEKKRDANNLHPSFFTQIRYYLALSSSFFRISCIRYDLNFRSAR